MKKKFKIVEESDGWFYLYQKNSIWFFSSGWGFITCYRSKEECVQKMNMIKNRKRINTYYYAEKDND